ncbi:MAG: L,D-transpeptidase [Methylocystis sp.]|uniref:L,D-transpeptidase n=1 Tax=Methylocystis sp. TaxID=1911079 RepID=UPI003D09BBEC
MLAAFAVMAGGICLAGCASTSPPVDASLVASAPRNEPVRNEPVEQVVQPETAIAGESASYAATKDAGFTVPAIKPGQVDPAFLRKSVAYSTKEPPGTIIVDTAKHYLYYVEAGGRATRYGIGVGRAGFAWSGEATIKSKQEWPDWYPPKEMIERRPDLKKQLAELQSGPGVHGGPSNPLGARAMYLWQGDRDTLFRIHGTNEPWTIGKSQSSGCIRMINQDAMDLYQKTAIGTRVVVLPTSVARR